MDFELYTIYFVLRTLSAVKIFRSQDFFFAVIRLFVVIVKKHIKNLRTLHQVYSSASNINALS